MTDNAARNGYSVFCSPSYLPTDRAVMTGPTRVSRRVLFVDGHEDSADSMAELLSMHGHEVRAVYTTLQALQAVPVYAPEVVVLDYVTPPHGACQAARLLADQPHGVRPRLLIAVTSFSGGDHVDAIAAAGFDHYFVKPVDPLALVRVLG